MDSSQSLVFSPFFTAFHLTFFYFHHQRRTFKHPNPYGPSGPREVITSPGDAYQLLRRRPWHTPGDHLAICPQGAEAVPASDAYRFFRVGRVVRVIPIPEGSIAFPAVLVEEISAPQIIIIKFLDKTQFFARSTATLSTQTSGEIFF